MRLPQSRRKVVYVLCGTLSVIDDLCEVSQNPVMASKQRTRTHPRAGDQGRLARLLQPRWHALLLVSEVRKDILASLLRFELALDARI